MTQDPHEQQEVELSDDALDFASGGNATPPGEPGTAGESQGTTTNVPGGINSTAVIEYASTFVPFDSSF